MLKYAGGGGKCLLVRNRPSRRFVWESHAVFLGEMRGVTEKGGRGGKKAYRTEEEVHHDSGTYDFPRRALKMTRSVFAEDGDTE